MSAVRAARLMSVLGAFALGVGLAHAEEAPVGCVLQTLAMATAGDVIDGRTFRLDDGREVRLAAIETPAPDTTPGPAAKLVLEKLVAGHSVLLKHKAPATDRYGHLLAQVFVMLDGSEYWVQQDMIAQGQARVGTRVGDPACAKALLGAENNARTAQLGLWADPVYALRRADDAPDLRAAKGRFSVAEGKVLSVREVGSTIYINLGRVWSRSLTVTILKRNMRAFAAAGVEPKKLENRRIRVRGWIEERGGPRIEATRPEQIEIAD
jgi:endonuclease YncB( thermonuclease family)